MHYAFGIVWKDPKSTKSKVNLCTCDYYYMHTICGSVKSYQAYILMSKDTHNRIVVWTVLCLVKPMSNGFDFILFETSTNSFHILDLLFVLYNWCLYFVLEVWFINRIIYFFVVSTYCYRFELVLEVKNCKEHWWETTKIPFTPSLYPMLINTLPYIHRLNNLVLNICTTYCNL